MRIITTVPAIIMLLIMLFGCNGGEKSTDPISSHFAFEQTGPGNLDTLPVIAFDGEAAIGIMGGYTLTISADDLTAELVPMRDLAIGESWIVSGRSYFDTQPSRDCFKITGLGYEDGRIIVDFGIRHPFEPGDTEQDPSARNRLDLDIFDLTMVVIPKPPGLVNYPLLNVSIPKCMVDSPDGFIYDFSGVAGIPIAFPYILIVDDSKKVPSAHTFNKFPMGGSKNFDVRFPVTSGETLVFDLYLTFAYGASATFENRLTPIYYNPEFNRKAAWKITAIPPNGFDEPNLGNTWSSVDDTTEYNVTVNVYDWQIGVNVNPDLDEETDVYASSEVDRVSVEIPGMTNEAITVAGDSYASGGTGMPGSPLVYTIPIANENLLPAGEYLGLVAVYDERSPLPVNDGRDYLIHSPDGGKTLEEFEIPAYITYQTFTATVMEGDLPHGGLIWAKQASGSGSNRGNGITKLSDNSIVVTGGFRRNIVFGKGEPGQRSLVSEGETDMFIARYNPDGSVRWARQIGAHGYNEGRGVTTLSDDFVVATGYVGTYDINAIYSTMYRSGGGAIWGKRALAPDGGIGSSITTLSDDSVVITGNFSGTAVFGLGEPNETRLTSAGHEGYPDIFISRYNLDGTLAWAKHAGGTDPNYGRAITALSDDSLVITGVFKGTVIFGEGETNETSFTSNEHQNIFIAKYNPDGSLQWAKNITGDSYGYGESVTALLNNSSVIAGRYNGDITLGTGEANETTLSSTGISNIFIACYNPDGMLEWAKDASGDGISSDPSLATSSDNSLIITGNFDGELTFGAGEPNETSFTATSTNRDMFIAWFNPDGTFERAVHSGIGDGSVMSTDITVLSDDSIVITGYFHLAATFGKGEPYETELVSAGLWDIFIARFAP